MSKEWRKALQLKTPDELDSNICVGDTIKIYGKETKVTGFYGAFNDGLMKWETIILTEGRGDPFERSLDVIEVLTPCDEPIGKTATTPPGEVKEDKQEQGEVEAWEKWKLENGWHQFDIDVYHQPVNAYAYNELNFEKLYSQFQKDKGR